MLSPAELSPSRESNLIGEYSYPIWKGESEILLQAAIWFGLNSGRIEGEAVDSVSSKLHWSASIGLFWTIGPWVISWDGGIILNYGLFIGFASATGWSIVWYGSSIFSMSSSFYSSNSYFSIDSSFIKIGGSFTYGRGSSIL